MGREKEVPIRKFADTMVQKLEANDHKKHWSKCSLDYLLSRLIEESIELETAIGFGTVEDIAKEAADVGNFAMMIHDNVTPKEIMDKHSGNKYLRKIPQNANGLSDVYDVLEAFKVTCPAKAHAIKKLLCSGIRGKGDTKQDLVEALDAIGRSIELQDGRERYGDQDNTI
jgi:phosphoribosyl-ATP pyrophosphohydrolase